MQKTSFFITLEGGEGVGKSTQSKLLSEAFRSLGREVVETREPGGTLEAEKIRDLVLKSPDAKWDPVSESLMMVAARHEHMRKKIFPALEAGKVVICDRFTDSTLAYQGYAGGLSLDFLTKLMDLAVGSFKPDLTFLFDMPIEASFDRVKDRGEALDHFEGKDKDFHEKLRQGFLDLARHEADRIAVIDATLSIDQVFLEVKKNLEKRLGVVFSETKVS